MNQPYFVLEFAHSIHGRVKRIQISHKSLGYLFCSLLIFFLLLFGMFSSYLRMTWKVSHYNQLRADFDRLRGRYQELQRASREDSEQIASLESLASEVTAAYGIDGSAARAKARDVDFAGTTSSIPGVKESIQEYNFLRGAGFSGIYHRYAYQWQTHTQPSLWPVNGILRSSFGGRSDPFSGEGAFHTGIDLSAAVGTPVQVTADGVVTTAGWDGAYGKLVIVDHGNGLETYYAHLSAFLVVPGEEVRHGQIIALSGGTGRATGPHIHYEVRLAGTPVNPYKYLAKTQVSPSTKPLHNDLGL
ncbi:MAG: M23 family metallopeptidase [Acidobacteriaceae bacterium]|nr:M23 family metallopeptidase [Acidobacteriaceae bacterium]MBV9294390.1 M23 family metallopeptidase [Acidobacteriaceae bacterium]MBV9765817.1 M23 family metallopeptidase [Acidobacteriaceae bacterium]